MLLIIPQVSLLLFMTAAADPDDSAASDGGCSLANSTVDGDDSSPCYVAAADSLVNATDYDSSGLIAGGGAFPADSAADSAGGASLRLS